MAEKKITKVEKIEMLLAIDKVAQNEMLVEFLKHEKELIQKKNSYKSVNKKKTAENEEIIKELESIFFENPNLILTCSDICRHLSHKYTTQKLSPQLRKMVEMGTIKEKIDKKVKYFSLA